MPRGRRSSTLDDTGKAILKALAESAGPAGCKQIAEKEPRRPGSTSAR